MPALAIRADRSPQELRVLAKGAGDARVARRLLAIANALSGMSRAAAAQSAGMDRQTLRDWVVRYNADGVAGLADRWGDGRPPRLDADEQAELAQAILDGPDPEVDGISAYTLEDLARLSAERFGKPFHRASMSRVVRRLGFSRQKARPHHPTRTKLLRQLLGGLGERLKAVADARPGKRIRLMFEDEARIGQKGRVCHRWYTRGKRPPGRADQRYTFAYIFAAAEPGTDNAFALVMPEVSTQAMQIYLDKLSATTAVDEHIVLVLDQAGWHGANDLELPANITLVPLPPRSPELNPVERLWLYLKERFLSHRLLDDYDAIVDAACTAWQRLTSEPGRVTSLCSYPWIAQVIA